ncbi:Fe(2+) transporter permease subunit FeoB [Methylohalobius crimeensis]|uniref:Fe(2+) transporter permease subunit FeoB n=1 Tax=Methylohalobius crimeensis TaxID=244365 RepID=UPI0003B7459A|nr:Fe(2+) transporter permease subunit FeoB [Methylohalobius crimeensis]
MTTHTIALIGNPNSGKTSLFNALTGARQRTGNWPGVTVERKEGRCRHGDDQFVLIDLPGTYSLDPGESSADERLAREFILSHQAEVIVNIADATHLERALYLTLQLIETGIPQVLALNMMDLAERQGIHLDLNALSEALGVPVVPLVARQGKGVEVLKQTVARQARRPHAGHSVVYPAPLAEAIDTVAVELAAAAPELPARWQALDLLSGYPSRQEIPEKITNRASELRSHVEQNLGEEMDLLIADARYQHARRIAQGVRKHGELKSTSPSDRIDAVVLNRWLGGPIFLLAMYLMFTFTINIGGAFIDFFDLAAAALLVDGFRVLLQSWGAPDWLQVLLADGIGGGLQVVATFIPIIGFLYLFLTFLEDSGYMARAALVMDRLMERLGLPGKAFVPLIVGFGCNVPAIMAARTLERERERILTVMMAPFMSCGARLAVYALFAAAFFPQNGQNIVFVLYLVGILAAMLTALLLKATLLPGEPEPLLMELPAYQWPSGRNLLLHTWLRLKGFVTDAGKYIVVMVMVVNVLNAWSTDGRFGPDVPPETSRLSSVARTITPAFRPLGIEEDNWPAIVGILSGVLAKEVVVGTLDALYSRLDQATDQVEADSDFSLPEALQEAAATIPANLKESLALLTDPLGFRVLDSGGNLDRAAEELEAHTSTFGAMVRRFDGQHGAFAYLLFVLLYFPCVAATATIRRETGWRWMLFAVSWTTGLAYAAATLYYQTVTFTQHPKQSQIYIGSILVAILLLYGLLKLRGRTLSPPPGAVTQTGNGPGMFQRSCCK